MDEGNQLCTHIPAHNGGVIDLQTNATLGHGDGWGFHGRNGAKLDEAGGAMQRGRGRNLDNRATMEKRGKRVVLAPPLLPQSYDSSRRSKFWISRYVPVSDIARTRPVPADKRDTGPLTLNPLDSRLTSFLGCTAQQDSKVEFLLAIAACFCL